MKQTILAAVLLAAFGSAMAQPVTFGGNTNVTVGGTVTNSIGTSASVNNLGGTSTSTATGFGAAAAVAGGSQTGGQVNGILGTSVTGVAGVAGGVQGTVVGGSARNVSDGAGATGYAYSVGVAGARADAGQYGEVHAKKTSAYELEGKTSGVSGFGVEAGTDEHRSGLAGQASGFLSAGGVAVTVLPFGSTSIAAGAVADVKGGISYATINNHGGVAGSPTANGAGAYNNTTVTNTFNATASNTWPTPQNGECDNDADVDNITKHLNNGWGNGDQGAPGNSALHNRAENWIGLTRQPQ